MKYDVFISHSSKDRNKVDVVVQYLEANGFTCFVSYRDIPPSSNWAETIMKSLEESRCVVYIHTPYANESKQIGREILIALDNQQKPVITYRLTDEEFKYDKKYFLQTLNWIDSLNNPAGALPLLAKTIAESLNTDEQVKDFKPVRHKKAKLPILILSIIGLGVGVFEILLSVEKRQQLLFTEDLNRYESLITHADSCIGIPDSAFVMLYCYDEATNIQEKYTKTKKEPLFTINATSKKQQALDSLNTMISPLITQVNQWYDVYYMIPDENFKICILNCINQLENIHSALGRPVPEDIIRIKKGLL